MDTVCSVGLISHRRPFTKSSTTVRTFRHALSLDEPRAKFKANHYNRPLETGPQQGTKPETDVKEVWFAGCHYGVSRAKVFHSSDSTSASVVTKSSDSTPPSSIGKYAPTLRWRIRECFRTNTGILFKTERFKGIGLDLDTLHLHADEDSTGLARPHSPRTMLPESPSPLIESTSTPRSEDGNTDLGAPQCQVEPEVHLDEESEEVKDALFPTHDMLVYKRMEHLGYKLKVKNWAKRKLVIVE